MSNVIGIPLQKGNNQVVIVVEITAANDIALFQEGQAVALRNGGIKPVVSLLSDDPENMHGFIFDINRQSRQCSLVRNAELVCLPSADAGALSEGDALKVNVATGLIDAAGTLVCDGRIMASGATSTAPNVTTAGVNGKTGEKVDNCVFVQYGGGAAVIPAP